MISLDRVGSIGAVLAAIAAPCCFPVFAAVGTAAGLGVLGAYEGVILSIFQAFAILTLAGLLLSARQYGNIGPSVVGGISCAALAYHFYLSFSFTALYGGLFGLIGATLWNYLSRGNANQPILESTITCPQCSHRTTENMPTNACVFFVDCPACGTRLKPLPGDCCVFCSYGSVKCPPIQAGESCCA